MTKIDTKSFERKLARRTSLVLLLVGLCSSLLLTFLMLSNFEKILLPQVLLKGNVIANAVRTTVADSIKLGIPYDALVGMDDYLSDTLLDNPEIEFIQVKSLDGKEYSLYRDGNKQSRSNGEILEEIAADEELPGVTIGLRATYAQEKLQIMFGDAVVALFVALLFGFEIILFFAVLWVLRPKDTWVAMINGLKMGLPQRSLPQALTGPLSELIVLTQQGFKPSTNSDSQGNLHQASKDWHEPQAYDVRIVLFLFVLSEEMLRAFFPIYVQDIALTRTLITVDVDIALPIMAYMLFAGLGTLFGGAVIARLGLRNTFKWSVLISTLGLGGMAFATTVPEVIALRTICAIGYAVATVSCQVYMMQTARNDAETTRGLATFVAAITAASLCGAPIGAVVAEVLGLYTAMLFAAGMAGLSWFFFQGLKMPSAANEAQPQSSNTSSKLKDFGELLKNRQVLIILLCDIAAGKLMLGGLLFYVTPILLISFQFSQTSIGQFFMLYYLPLIFGNMLIARVNPGPHLKIRIMIAGALLTGSGALLLYWFNSAAALAAAIMCIGLGQSMVLTMSTSVILSITRAELPHISTPNTLALARAFERVGGVLGAGIVAIFSLSFNYREAAVGLGVCVLVLCLGNLGLVLRSTVNKQASLQK